MFLDHNIAHYVVHGETFVRQVLRKIDSEKGRIVFVVDSHDRLIGVVTNGDILRWLAATETPDLEVSIEALANRSFISASPSDPAELIQRHLRSVLFVPLVDHGGHLVAVARRETPSYALRIGERLIGDDQDCYVIAEIGNNHNGDIELARRLVQEAASAGADCVKFQMRRMEVLYGKADSDSENLGTEYTLDLLSRFQLSDEELIEMFDYARSLGVEPLCTPWDQPSLETLEQYGVAAYKTASADLTNPDLLAAIAATKKTMLCSTGMSTEAEIETAIEQLKRFGTAFVMLHCNSTYPAPLADINLAYLHRLRELAGGPVGYSGHERGIAVSLAAVAHGARVIERHITLDRSMEGNDHRASLLPSEFAELVSGIREVDEARGQGTTRTLSQGELINRVTLAKSLIASRPIGKNETITADAVDVRSPGRGLQPAYRDRLVGRTATREMNPGDFFFPSDLNDNVVSPRQFRFARPWGIPVRYHDYRTLTEKLTPDILEFHLSYKDIELDLGNYFDEQIDCGLVVHCPELFARDHVVDLCSPDDDYRMHSIVEVRRLIELVRRLSVYFRVNKPTPIVINVGGFSDHGFLTPDQRCRRVDQLRRSLDAIDSSGVELLPQTMPPFPWHFGGQRFHNIFMDADSIVELCDEFNLRVCFDTSHSHLACRQHHTSFTRFTELVGPYTAHLHVADASGTDGEGLQIGDGEMDMRHLARLLNQFAPTASFIPEVWQGHENGGEGFWLALDRLESAGF